ncbi:hypothetical protein ElyMa_003423100 [Elysia marginata]|uniref:Uncharacterized protein n=1 Tax=Elysia marginata TaxID=1093978 RepID=A0AAV4JSM1_9GAST|nr:hypothetical protein ElyMa_003423100 [Elysia marginata]
MDDFSLFDDVKGFRVPSGPFVICGAHKTCDDLRSNRGQFVSWRDVRLHPILHFIYHTSNHEEEEAEISTPVMRCYLSSGISVLTGLILQRWHIK